MQKDTRDLEQIIERDKCRPKVVWILHEFACDEYFPRGGRFRGVDRVKKVALTRRFMEIVHHARSWIIRYVVTRVQTRRNGSQEDSDERDATAETRGDARSRLRLVNNSVRIKVLMLVSAILSRKRTNECKGNRHTLRLEQVRKLRLKGWFLKGDAWFSFIMVVRANLGI